MRIFGCLIVLALVILPIGAADAASRITTKDGTVIIGDIESLQSNVYTIRTPYGAMRIPAASVNKIEPTSESAPQPAAQKQGAPSSGAGERQSAAPSSGPLRFAGSNTIGAELVPRLLEAYAAKLGAGDFEWRGEGEDRSLSAKGAGGAKFEADVAAHGSGTAAPALAAGKADIGMMSRPIKDKEVASLAAVGFGQADKPGQEHVLALDGIVVVVNKANPVKALTLSQIQGLFSGEITDWSQVGGKPGPVQVYSRDDKSGTFDTFKSLVLKDKKLVGSAKRYESHRELSDDVASDEHGIGFVGFAYVRNAHALTVATDCGLSFEPAEYSVKTEEYPLARRLFLYTPQRATNGNADPFVDFALSSAAQPTAEKEGFVSLLPQTAGSGYVGQRIQQAAQSQEDTSAEASRAFTQFTRAIAKGNRLSITYRFQTASDALDSRAVRDIERLAEFLNLPENRGRKVLLAGFADPRGAIGRNVVLSRARAEAVAAELRKHGVNPEIEGFGPVAPVACNDSEAGWAKNRRVEVWLQ